jgi:hypothetical protein
VLDGSFRRYLQCCNVKFRSLLPYIR